MPCYVTARMVSLRDPSHEHEPVSTRILRVLGRTPPSERRFEAPEVYGREAIGNIARALPPFERAYANIRFSILRP